MIIFVGFLEWALFTLHTVIRSTDSVKSIDWSSLTSSLLGEWDTFSRERWTYRRNISVSLWHAFSWFVLNYSQPAKLLMSGIILKANPCLKVISSPPHHINVIICPLSWHAFSQSCITCGNNSKRCGKGDLYESHEYEKILLARSDASM